MLYAGFWRRFIAIIIDGLILMVAGAIFGLFVGLSTALGDTSHPVFGATNFLGIAVTWLYFALMESSGKQATLGKMAMGIRVTDLWGRPIGFGRATGRYFGKIISGLILYIGFIMAAFTERKQALHDIMAGCLVMNNPDLALQQRDE